MDVCDSHIGLSFFETLGQTIEEISMEGTFIDQGQHFRVQLPHLKSLRLQDCTDFLPFLFPINSCSLEEVFVAIEDHYVHQWYGKLLDLLNWQRWDTYDFRKHDGSLATFTRHMTQLIESLEWPIDGDFWEADSQYESSEDGTLEDRNIFLV